VVLTSSADVVVIEAVLEVVSGIDVVGSGIVDEVAAGSVPQPTKANMATKPSRRGLLSRAATVPGYFRSGARGFFA
jgi:hypothetical protein